MAIVPGEVIEAMQERLEDLFHQIDAQAARIEALEGRRVHEGKADGWDAALNAAAALVRRQSAELWDQGHLDQAIALDDVASRILGLRTRPAEPSGNEHGR